LTLVILNGNLQMRNSLKEMIFMRNGKYLSAIALILVVMLCLCGCARKDDLSDLKFADDTQEQIVSDAQPAEETPVKPEDNKPDEPKMSDEELFDYIVGEWRQTAMTNQCVGGIMNDPDGNRLYIVDATHEFTKDGSLYRNYYGAKNRGSNADTADYVKREDLHTKFRVENGKIIFQWFDESGKELGTNAHDVEIIDHDHMNTISKSNYAKSGYTTTINSRK